MASGSLLTKIWKGLHEMKNLGLVDDVRTKINGAQAEGCSPISTAFKSGRDFFKPVKPKTIAKSLAIGNPADGYYPFPLRRIFVPSLTPGLIFTVYLRRRRSRPEPWHFEHGFSITVPLPGSAGTAARARRVPGSRT